MKKVCAIILAIAMTFALAACGGKTSTQTSPSAGAGASASGTAGAGSSGSSAPVELTVFAAASMTETMNTIKNLYKQKAPNVTLTYTFDSSGTLETQIKQGADCDVFISAAQKQMNELDKTSSADTDGSDYVLPGTRFNIVENKVALVVPDKNPAGVSSFNDIGTSKVTKIALGNSDVPVGQYSQEILTNMGVWDSIQKKITFGSNVKEVTTWVSEGTVDCGVVYATDANAAKLQIVGYAPDGTIKTPVVYPAAAMKNSKKADAAKAFLDFLKTDTCTKVFTDAGFSIPSK